MGPHETGMLQDCKGHYHVDRVTAKELENIFPNCKSDRRLISKYIKTENTEHQENNPVPWSTELSRERGGTDGDTE